MLVSGLVLTLADDAAAAERAVRDLASRAGVTLGERSGRWVAVAAEAPDDAALRAVHGWIEECPGVAMVDVVFVDFGAPEPGREGTEA